MKTLIGICLTTLLITAVATDSPARVIANDLSENAVAVYYFSSQNDGRVTDSSGNGLTGLLFNNAQISTIQGRKCLSMGTNAADFEAWDDNEPLHVSKEFSIVAWVKIPQQLNDFFIEVAAYDHEIENMETGFRGGIDLSIGTDGELSGAYYHNSDRDSIWVATVGRTVNNNRWHHVGVVVNKTSMKLYLNGNRVGSQLFNEHQSFSGTGTAIRIGDDAFGSVDNVGVFRNDFSDAQVRLIYNVGLATIMSIAPVDPNDKVATTWATLKQQ
jgi:hypothetical protein